MGGNGDCQVANIVQVKLVYPQKILEFSPSIMMSGLLHVSATTSVRRRIIDGTISSG